jgi:CheY-like chemotaxis protein
MASSQAANPLLMTPAKFLTVFIVDDDADDRFFMEQALRNDSPTSLIYLADSGQQALDLLGQVHPAPDVILLDLNMPGLSGFEVLEQLKQSTQHQHILVIVLTTSSALIDEEQAYRLGADGFITKPTTQQGLHEIAERIRQNWANL